MGWRFRRPPKPLTDAEFNAEIDQWLKLWVDTLAEPGYAEPEFFPMCYEIREKSVGMITAYSEDDTSPSNWPEFAGAFGRSRLRWWRKSPQAVFFFHPRCSAEAQESVEIHGATLDGRLNAARIVLRRDESGNVRPAESFTWHFPMDSAEHTPESNCALRIVRQWADG